MSNYDEEIVEIAKMLRNIHHSKEFIQEVLIVLQARPKLTDPIFSYLQENPVLVAAEVYDELEHLTDGAFRKELPSVRMAKELYFRYKTDEYKDRFLDELSRANQN